MTTRPGERTISARPQTRRPTPAPPRPDTPAGRFSGLRRPAILCAKIVLPLAVLAVVAIGLLYVRILYGPISLKMLAQPIADSISAELQDFDVTVDDALVRLNEEGGIEVRLRNVRLIDDDGDAVAMAPLAAVEISGSALWRARLAPSKVVLIEPRVLLSYSSQAGLTFSFARTTGTTAPDAPVAVPPPAAPVPAPPVELTQTDDAGLPVVLRQVGLARTVADLTARARRRADAASYLRELGLRNATVIFEQNASQTSWLVPQIDIALAHRGARSVIEGDATVSTARGPFGLHFWTETSEAKQQVQFKAAFRDLVPNSIATAFPALPFLRTLDLPAHGEVTLDLTSDGNMQGGAFTLDLARGRMQLPWAPNAPVDIEGGRLDLRYMPGEQMLRVAPSTLAWGRSRLTVQGQIVSAQSPDGAEAWTFDLGGVEGQLAVDEIKGAPLPLEAWVAKGAFRPRDGTLNIVEYVIQAGGGQMRLSGRVGVGEAVDLEGQISAMPYSALLGLWPRGLAHDARTWVAEHINKGRVLGGNFKHVAHMPSAGADRLSVALEAADITMTPVRGLPPVEVPRGLLRLEGSSLEVTMPDASMTTANGRKLAFKAGRFTAVDVNEPVPTGQLAFRGQGPAAAFLELIELDRIGIRKLTAVNSDTVDGKIEGQLTLTMPLHEGLTARELKVEGRVRATEGRARRLIANRDAQAATVNVDISEKAIEARGDMLIAGVPVKLGWQHIFDAPPELQPPLRLNATLDAADRTQLGMDVNHVVQGEIPVEVTITQPEENQHNVQVRADLTRADMVIDNVAWRKPPGRAAMLQFDMLQGERHPVELHNFRIVGDDIAISGWVGLDANNRMREFQFPEFSVSVVTRLDVRGTLRQDNVWDIAAKGQTYDGRDFFRALFSVGDLADKPAIQRKDPPGLDLKADIETVLGFSDVSLRGVTMHLIKRGEKMTQLTARGTLDGGRPLEIGLQPGDQRRLVASSDDAGQVFKLVDFYPSMVGGKMRLEVNLDGRGAAEQTGLLRVERFRILGDPVVSEVLQFPDETRQIDRPRQQRVVRQVIEFDWLRVPFSVGYGQFVMGDSEIRGPLVGATMRGKADFRARQINVGGTYVPLQGLNSAIGVIPGLGQILAGPRGEGVLGITFAIQGSMNSPQVLVNPLSLVAPGIFREMFQLTPNQSVTPPRAAPQRTAPESKARSSSSPASAAPSGQGGSKEPEVLSGWSSETNSATKKK